MIPPALGPALKFHRAYIAQRGVPAHGFVEVLAVLLDNRPVVVADRLAPSGGVVDQAGGHAAATQRLTEGLQHQAPIQLRIAAFLGPEVVQRMCTSRIFLGEEGRCLLRNVTLRKQTARFCDLTGVPTVCAHAMRGLHSTLAVEAGTTPHVVAASLGHESPSVTLRSYVAPGSAEQAKARRVLTVLHGGRGGQ